MVQSVCTARFEFGCVRRTSTSCSRPPWATAAATSTPPYPPHLRRRGAALARRRLRLLRGQARRQSTNPRSRPPPHLRTRKRTVTSLRRLLGRQQAPWIFKAASRACASRRTRRHRLSQLASCCAAAASFLHPRLSRARSRPSSRLSRT